MNRGLVTAFRRGYEARQKKWIRESCPYPDLRTERGGVTFSRAYRNAWFAGYDRCRHDEYHGDYEGFYNERIEG